jgi:1,2-phenylacetyl-CoA epoxidase catalytic subunit
MLNDEAKLVAHIAAGGRIGAADEVSPGYRAELMRLMAVFVDSELAGAAGFADIVNRAPGLRERATTARIVSEKFAHAEAVLGLMARFGVNPALYVRSHAWAARLDRSLDLGARRAGGDKRLNVFHYPLEGWTDAVAMNLLMGLATAVQLGELAACSYGPLAGLMADIVKREAEHAGAGESGLAQAIERDGSTAAARVAIEYWHPRVAATFGRLDSDRVELYRRYGLRRSSNAGLHERWQRDVGMALTRLGLSEPA